MTWKQFEQNYLLMSIPLRGGSSSTFIHSSRTFAHRLLDFVYFTSAVSFKWKIILSQLAFIDRQMYHFLRNNCSFWFLLSALCLLCKSGKVYKRKATTCNYMCEADESMFGILSPGKSSSKYSQACRDLAVPVLSYSLFLWQMLYWTTVGRVKEETRRN